MPTTTPRPIAEIHAARKFMLAGRPRDALRRIASIQIPFATLHIVRGECCYVLGQWMDAVREFESALRLSPNSPRAEILLMLASEMLELSRTMRPATNIAQSIASDKPEIVAPTMPRPTIDRTKLSKEEPSESVDEIGLVSETLAELMIRQGKFDEARKVYIQLSRLNPDRYEYFRERMQKLENQE
jgi:tetratricopeptide (TPR) repeat protein